MGEAIGQILPLAIGVALSPVPIIAVVLMLGTPKASSNGPAFVLGWIVGLSLVGAIILLVSSGADASDEGAPAEWVGWLKLVLGILLLVVAMRTWRSRPRGSERRNCPVDAVDRPLHPGRATAMGVAFSAVNPENLLLTVGCRRAIAQTGIGSGDQAVALAVFVVIATLGPGLPVGMYFAMRERATQLLGELEGWMAATSPRS